MKVILFLLSVALGGCVTTPQFVGFGSEYLGKPYINSPLGEGVAPDTDPLIRYDAFDCTTFVETVLAHNDLDSLNKIRYQDGKIGFVSRNHFIESDWLPNNSNLVYNVSAEYGKTKIRNVTIDKASWFKTVHNINTNIAPQNVSLQYLPYDGFETIENAQPLIVLFIVGKCKNCDKIGTDIAVVHMGFLLPGGVLRHASSSQGCVIDTDFYEYVKMRRGMNNNIGIVLLGIK